MTSKLVLLLATVALNIVSAASTYKITLFQASTLNGTELKPGSYKIELKDDKAVISKGKESVEANVKTETSDTKFNTTTVRYNNGGGKYQIQEIRLGGTNTVLVFAN